jgi:signal transduction histidine kinase
VALVDSYLISLTRDEIDALINQNDEIFVNLKEPVQENFVEDLLQKETDFVSKATPDQSESEERGSVDDETVLRPTVVDEEKTMDYFKSISNFSRLNDSNIIPQLEKFKKTFEEVSEPEEKQTLEPHQEVVDHSKIDFTHEPETAKEEPPLEKLPFDENNFLNEDGIPKAEFELPEAKEEPIKIVEPQIKSDGNLDDALFQILSGGNMLNFEPFDKEETIKNKPEEISYNDIITSPIHEAIPAEENTEQEIPIEELPKLIEKKEEPVAQEIQTTEETKFHFEDIDNEPLPADLFSALERISSSLDQSDVYKNVIDSGKGITSSNYGILYNLDWTKNELWTLIESSFGKKEIRLKIGEGLAGFSAKNDQVIIVNNIKTEMRFKFDVENNLDLDVQKILVFPIKDKKNEIVAVLELIRNQPEDFKPVDEEKLSTLSIFFATALKNSENLQNIIKNERALSLTKVSNFLEQEVKRPLLSSKRYVEHLKTKRLQPDASHVLDLLSEQLNQVSDVVTVTTNYSENKMPLRTTNVSLNSSLNDFSMKVEQYVESKLCQIINVFDGDTTVKMDVKEFFQCYRNIIKNGCEAMPDGGKIFVSTKKHGRNIEIHIKDNGSGISDEIKPKLFEPFMSEGKKVGTGLGLAIAKKIVEAHNGSLHVESEIGEGADFVITLPIVSSF